LKISHSIICEKHLENFIVDRYKFPSDAECTFLLQGVNDSYLVVCGYEKYVFRLYRCRWRTEANVLEEVALLSFLGDVSAPVAEVVRDGVGAIVQTIKCPEGDRFGILMRCAANSENESHCIVTGNINNYGKSIARLHNATTLFEGSNNSTLIDVDHLIFKPLALVENAFSGREELVYLRGFARRIAGALNSFENVGITKCYVHGDLTGGNASVDENGDFIFFDFDCCGYGWLSYDLAVLLWSATLFGKEDFVWKEFIRGYLSIATIKDSDIEIVPLLVAARNFWIMGYSISQIAVKGKLSYKLKDFIRDVDFFKKWKNTLPT
jgi:Ser/Thr protein kinase RdoA (MazF antagonist)